MQALAIAQRPSFFADRLFNATIYDDGYIKLQSIIIEKDDKIEWWLTAWCVDTGALLGTSNKRTVTPTVFAITRAGIEAVKDLFRAQLQEQQ